MLHSGIILPLAQSFLEAIRVNLTIGGVLLTDIILTLVTILPSEDVKCTVALSVNTKEELLEAIIQHGTKVHGYEDTPEFVKIIVKVF